MKFFNIDVHVAVISDVATNLAHLGHSVEEHSMSGHYWALNKPRASRGTGPGDQGKIGYGPINMATWETAFNEDSTEPWPGAPLPTISHAMLSQCPELANFDGFINCHPPVFAYLWARFNKPIILNMSLRYEWPFQNDSKRWNAWNNFLTQRLDAGTMAIVGNSEYECAYFEYFTGRKIPYISSLCEYIDKFAPKYSGRQDVVYSMGHTGKLAEQVPGVCHIRSGRQHYAHPDLSAAKAIVWLPYNASIMSFFEQYWLNIPIFVPSQRLLLQTGSLSQISWSHGNGSLLPRVGNVSLPDPNLVENYCYWLHLADFYNAQEFPHLIYFDTWEELKYLLVTTDYKSVSAKMAKHNDKRKTRNLGKWVHVFNKLYGFPPES